MTFYELYKNDYKSKSWLFLTSSCSLTYWDQLTFRPLEQIKLNTIELKSRKLNTLLFELSSLQEKSSALLLRRATVTPDVTGNGQFDTLNSLIASHDLLEANFFSYIENECSSPANDPTAANFQVFRDT